MFELDNEINENLYETKFHGTLDFPFSIYKNQFSENNLKFINFHWHPEIEIVYVQSGTINYNVGEQKYILNEGDAMLVMPNQLHGANYVSDATWYALLINPRLIFQNQDSIIYEKYFKNFNFNNILLNQNEIKITQSIINSYYEEIFDYELEIISNLYQLWLSVVKRPIEDKNTSKISSYRLKRIIDYINQNFSKKIKIDDLSKEVNLCRSEICKLFRESLNTTFTEYLIKFRLEKSLDLLLSNKTNITEICDLVGFNSSSYFTEVFKKYFGQTPLTYKKIYLKKDDED